MVALRQLVKIAKELPPPLRRVAAVLYRLPEQARFALGAPYYHLRRMRRRAALRGVQDKLPLILFLAPEAGLTQFYTGHALLAKTLAEAGHQVAVMSCYGTLAMCSLKSAIGPDARARDGVCGKCRQAALTLGEKYGLPDISVDSMITDNEKTEIEALIAKGSDAPWTVCYDGIAFGEFALGETLRSRRKLKAEDLDTSDRAELVATLTAGLQNYFAVRNIAAQYDVRRFVYYGAYAYWLPVVMYARAAGIPTVQIEHGYNRDIDLRLLNLRPIPVHEQQAEQITHWADFRDIPLGPETLTAIAESGLYRLSNHGRRSTHSPNFVRRERSILEDFGLPQTRKTLIAYSSSADEFLAARHILHASGRPYDDTPRPFEDSNAWLKALVDWVGSQSDMQLILRLHPRLSTRQGQSLSAEEHALRALLADLPENVRIVWPRDDISSYNLAEAADVALVSWSTIGLELARFGVPVIAAFPDRGPFPVRSFISFEETRDSYFAAIRKALGRPASYKTIAEAMRWTHFLFLSPTVDFSESIPAHDFVGIPDWVMPADKGRIVQVLVDGKDASQLKMEGLARDACAEAAELEALQRVVERIIIFFMTGQDSPTGRINEAVAQNGNVVVLSHGGHTYRHTSPLVHRLVTLWNGENSSPRPSMASAS